MTSTESSADERHVEAAIWCFAGRDMWALTDCRDGRCLPLALGPWSFRQQLTLASTIPDEAEALRLIGEHGFCCFDPYPAETDSDVRPA